MTNEQDFTALQYYLAHAKNTVHLILKSPQDVSQDEFKALVERVLSDAPQLNSEESLVRNALKQIQNPDLDRIIDYKRSDRHAASFDEIDKTLSEPLFDTGQPAFRAICRTSAIPGVDGVKSWIVFQASHSIMEGGDVASIIRGRGSVHADRPIVEAGLTTSQRFGSSALVPILWVLHMLAAKAVKLSIDDFTFRRVSLDRRTLSAAARQRGISQRVMLFGLVTHGLKHKPGKKSPLNLVYSVLPAERARLYDDEFLNVRMDDFRLRSHDNVEAHLTEMSNALASRGPSPLFVQTWQRKLNGIHQKIHTKVPALYPDKFFGFSPYDLILSLLPPFNPGRYNEILAGSRAFAGSNTGTSPSCIFAVNSEEVTLNLWSDPEIQRRIPELIETSASVDVRASIADEV